MFRPVVRGFAYFMVIIGVAMFTVESYSTRAHKAEGGWQVSPPKHVDPEPWMPWAMIATGTVIILWTVTLPKAMKAE